MQKTSQKSCWGVCLICWLFLACGSGAWAQTNGTLVGSPTFATASSSSTTLNAANFGNAITLNGTSQYITLAVPGPLDTNPTSTLTWECRVRTTVATGQHVALGHVNGGSYISIGVNVGKAYFASTGFNSGLNNNGTTTISDGNWHTIALVVTSGTSATLYVDGNAEATQTGTLPTLSAGTAYIGGWSSSTVYFSGQIDEVALSNTAQYAGAYTPATNIFSNTRAGQLHIYHLESDGTDSYTPASATAYTLSGNTTGGNGLAQTLTLTSNGNLASSVTVTIAVSTGAATLNGGSLTNTTVTLPSGNLTSVTFTVQAVTSGSSTLHFTNSSTLTNPGDATYTSIPSVLVNSAAVKFSPGNWSGDTGRGGSVYRVSWNAGAYSEWYWSDTASNTTITLYVTNQTAGSTIAYTLDGALTDAVSVPTSGGISISVASSGAHVLRVINRQLTQSARWNLTNAFKVSGLTLTSTATPGTAPALGPWILEIGDSISEALASGTGATDNVQLGYTYLVGQALKSNGWDYGISACGYSGWIQTGDAYGTGDVPRYYYVSSGTYQGDSVSRWNLISSGVSLLDSNGHISAYGSTGTEPSLITINYGTNDCLTPVSSSDMQLSIQGALTKLRAAAPSAYIVVYVPFGLYSSAVYGSNGAIYATAIKTAVAAYLSANPSDTKTSICDFGSGMSATLTSTLYGGAIIHPIAIGHAYVGAAAIRYLQQVLTPAAVPARRFIH